MGNFLSNLFTADNLKGLLGAGGGALLGGLLAPKPPQQQPISAATLNAATLPQMQQAAKLRMAHLLGAQGAKGGRSSADTLEAAQLNQELARGVGAQRAMNEIQANTAMNSALAANYMGQRQRLQDILSGATTGYNYANPAKQPRGFVKNADGTYSYTY